MHLSPRTKDKKGKRPSAILNKFLILRRVELIVCSAVFWKSSVFVCPHVHAKTVFSKLRFHSGESFPKVPFSSVRARTCENSVFKTEVPLWREFSKSSVFIDRFTGGSRIFFKEGVVSIRVQGKRPKSKGMGVGEGNV